MPMRNPLRVLIGLAVLGTGLPAVLVAQQRDPALVGVWRLVGEVDRRPDGSVVATGPAAGYNGLLIFTSSGYMSSTIMPNGRTWKREAVTSEELRETFEGASVHAGRYEPDSARRSIRMENVMSLDPADEGHWDVVGYRVQGDSLELSGPWTYKGERLAFSIRLARVSGPPRMTLAGSRSNLSTTELSASDLAAIRATSAQWLAAVRQGRWEAAAATYTDDAVLWLGNAAFTGREAILKSLQGQPPLSTLDLHIDEIRGRGDMAFVSGYSTITPVGGTPVVAARYMDVRLRQRDGTWRFYRDMVSPVPPPASEPR